MGVSGAGKTLVGRAVAGALGWTFLDADDFHSPSNIAKMRGGTPLEPSDRIVWLQAMRAALAEVQHAGGNAVLACSALRRQLRESLREGLDDVRFVYLRAEREVIRERVSSRTDHFMPASLVDSQYETLEEPDDAIVVDASKSPAVIVREIVEAAGRPS